MLETNYPPTVNELIDDSRLNVLGPGTPNPSIHTRLTQLTPQTLLEPHTVADTDMARACLSALWLHHDYLDESHTISQDIPTSTGSYWHAIMHRREGDFGNSAYWFRRVGNHPVFAQLGEEAQTWQQSEGNLLPKLPLSTNGDWDPFTFGELCEGAVRKRNAFEDQCRQLQQLEWRLLFDFCYQAAVSVS